MTRIDHEKLALLEKAFSEHPGGVELVNFVSLLKCTVGHDQRDEYSLVDGLVKLFSDIDINGDKHIEWHEFTQYIVDAVISKKDNEMEIFATDGQHKTGLAKSLVMKEAFASAEMKYTLADKDLEAFKQFVTKILPLPSFNLTAIREDLSDKVKLVDKNLRLVQVLDLPQAQQAKFSNLSTTVLDVAANRRLGFVRLDHQIGVLTSDHQAFFWSVRDLQRLLFKQTFKMLTTDLKYLEASDYWVILDFDNCASFWKMKTRLHHDVLGFEECLRLQLHSDKISGLVEVVFDHQASDLDWVVSSSFDGTIKIWHALDLNLLRVIEEKKANTQGFTGNGRSLGVCMNRHHSGTIVAWSFTNKIQVYNPYTSLLNPQLGTFEGHSAIVTDCRLLHHTFTCISIDQSRCLKIWSVALYATLQTVNLDLGYAVRTLEIMPDDSFLLASKKVCHFKNEDLKRQLDKLGDVRPIRASFNPHFKHFLVVSRHDAKVFNSSTGQIAAVFADLLTTREAELTAFCEGARHRKLFFGDSQGFIRMANAKTGRILGAINDPDMDHSRAEQLATSTFYVLAPLAERSVGCLLYLPNEKLLVSTSNSIIFVHDDLDSEQGRLIKVFIGGHNETEITALHYMHQFNLLFSGSIDGLITLWNLETSKLVIVLYGHSSPIIGLFAIDNLACLASVSTDGQVSLWELALESYGKFRLIATFFLQEATTRGDLIQLSTAFYWSRTCDHSELRMEPLFDLKLAHLVDRLSVNEASVSKLTKKLQQPKAFASSLNHSDFKSLFDQCYPRTLGSKGVDRDLLVLGTKDGRIMILDLKPFLLHKKIPELKPVAQVGQGRLRRIEDISVHKLVAAHISQAIRTSQAPEVFDACRSLLVARWQAHEEKIEQITAITTSGSLLTCSKDASFQVWSLNGNLVAQVNLASTDRFVWHFQYDWITAIHDDFEKVFKVLEVSRGKKIPAKDREAIVKEHLEKVYISAKQKAQFESKPVPGKFLASTSVLPPENEHLKGRPNKTDKKEQAFIEKQLAREADKALLKSSNFRNMTVFRTGFQSVIANDLANKFKVISKEEEDKLVGNSMHFFSGKVLTQLRKPRFSKMSALMPDLNIDPRLTLKTEQSDVKTSKSMEATGRSETSNVEGQDPAKPSIPKTNRTMRIRGMKREDSGKSRATALQTSSTSHFGKTGQKQSVASKQSNSNEKNTVIKKTLKLRLIQDRQESPRVLQKIHNQLASSSRGLSGLSLISSQQARQDLLSPTGKANSNQQDLDTSRDSKPLASPTERLNSWLMTQQVADFLAGSKNFRKKSTEDRKDRQEPQTSQRNNIKDQKQKPDPNDKAKRASRHAESTLRNHARFMSQLAADYAKTNHSIKDPYGRLHVTTSSQNSLFRSTFGY